MEEDIKIPIKNIYYMLCYAWDIFEYSDDMVCGSEEFDNIYNLLARIMCKEVSSLIKRGFYREYIEITQSISKLKGQIDITQSIGQMANVKNQMVCIFDEYSDNVLFNQIIKSTMIDLLKYQDLTNELKIQLKKYILYFNDIDYIEISKRHFLLLRFNRNNLNYQMIINVCKLLKYGLIANSNGEGLKFAKFLNENTMSRVYELFILNFYKRNFNSSIYSVEAPKINWPIDINIDENLQNLFDIEYNPGDRRTDISIINKVKNIQLIIDAKYYKEMLVSKYNNNEQQTYRTGHLNQIRGYIMDSKFSGKKYGSLMYPTVKPDPSFERGKLVPITSANVIFKTLNLNTDWENIKNDLLNFAYKIVK